MMLSLHQRCFSFGTKCQLILLFFFIYLLSFDALAQVDTAQQQIPNRVNSLAQQEKPYVILISIDGFRWDLADKYQAKNLIKLRTEGVQAEYLKPSFPSLTFPNHYTIVTGLYPSHHGIVDNIFYDRSRSMVYKKSDPKIAFDPHWYGGKPLWVLAEQQNMLSAAFYWIGSEVAIDGVRPTYYYNYNETIPVDRRIVVVKDWLNLPAEKRPHLIALYFPQVDKAGHKFSPDSEETKQAVQQLDEAIGKLQAVAATTKLPINFVVVSDHGMTSVDRENTIPLPNAVSSEKFIVPPGNAIVQLYAKDKIDIKPTYRKLKNEAKDYTVYLRNNIPKSWRYGVMDDLYGRIGDLILVPKLPKVFNINGIRPDVGQHGFSPDIKDMRAIFYAWGPQFKSGMKIPAFENVHIYPMIAKLLGLSYDQKIDGKEIVLMPILK